MRIIAQYKIKIRLIEIFYNLHKYLSNFVFYVYFIENILIIKLTSLLLQYSSSNLDTRHHSEDFRNLFWMFVTKSQCEVRGRSIMWAQIMLTLLKTFFNNFPENCASSSKTIWQLVKKDLTYSESHICIQIINFIFLGYLLFFLQR